MITRRMFTAGLAASLVAALAGIGTSLADEARPVLTVVPPHGAAVVSLTTEELEGLGLTTVSTSMPWTGGPQLFRGVPLDMVVARYAPDATTVELTALNDHRVEFPVIDGRDYHALLATSINGERMPVREKGPSWLIFPIDQYPELDSPLYDQRMIWQVKEILLR